MTANRAPYGCPRSLAGCGLDLGPALYERSELTPFLTPREAP